MCVLPALLVSGVSSVLAVHSPSCVSIPAACRSLLSMCSREHLSLFTNAAKLIILTISPCLHAASPHNMSTSSRSPGSIRHQAATPSFFFAVLSNKTACVFVRSTTN